MWHSDPPWKSIVWNPQMLFCVHVCVLWQSPHRVRSVVVCLSFHGWNELVREERKKDFFFSFAEIGSAFCCSHQGWGIVSWLVGCFSFRIIYLLLFLSSSCIHSPAKSPMNGTSVPFCNFTHCNFDELISLSLSLSNSLLSVALPSFWMIHIDWLAIPWWKKARGIKCTKREDPTSWQCSSFF